MAKKVNEWPTTARRRYPWEQWLDGEMWELERGTDFYNTPNAFRTQAYVAATARGVKVRTTAKKNGSLVIQAYED